MRLPTPIQAKIPYEISPEPMDGAITAFGGAALLSRLFRSMKLPGSCDANLGFMRKIEAGYPPGQIVETIILGLLLGIDCVEDLEMLRDDAALERLLGYSPPSTRTIRDWLEKFHNADLVSAAEERANELDLKAIIPELSNELEALQRVLGTSMRAAAASTCGETLTSATIDSDGTIIQSHKATAKVAYDGTKGYQPLTAIWAEADLIVSTQFRDGNVPGHMSPLDCVKEGFSQLPKSVTQFAFRGDSANYNCELMDWLDNPERNGGPQGVKIQYAISARMSEELLKTAKSIPESEWNTIPGKNEDDVLRQWSELAYVPSESYERKSSRPRRYIGLRIIKKQGELFGDGSDRKHFAIVTNRAEAGNLVLQWHREKAGTIEHTQDELKNALSAARLPSKLFGANSAWFMLNAIAYNLATAFRMAIDDPDLRTARIKRLRFCYFTVTARVTRFSRKMTLRFAKCKEWVKKLLKILKKFPCRIQPTG